MPRPRRVAAALALLVVAVGPAAAHEVAGTRFDAPLPLPLLYVGAGAVVAATAGWFAWRPGGSGDASPVVLARVPPTAGGVVAAAARVGFLAVAVCLVAAGLLGRQTPTNPAVVVFWALWLKGLLVVSALAGSPWRVLSPWRTVHRALERVEDGPVRLLSYPDRLGEWPALAGFVAVGALENLTTVPRSPERTAALLAAYATAMLAGGVVFGREWYRRADVFAVLYRLVGRVSPLRVESDDRGTVVALRRPWTACARPVESAAVAAFVVASVYVVSFDGFTSTPEYRALAATLRDAGASGTAGLLLFLAGLGCFLVAFAGVLAATAALADDRWRALLTAVPASVLPIAVGYELAHNATYVVRSAGALVGALTGHAPGLLAWLSLPAYWSGQVVLVVGGHVVAVAAAHRALSARYPHRTAVRAHLPLVALMVAYTVLSLWLVSRPVVG